jgi:hypothetical protein
MPFKMALSIPQEGCPTEPFRLLLGLGGLEAATSGKLRGVRGLLLGSQLASY